MDTALVRQLISEALTLTPNKPESNGYGFAVAVVVSVAVVCLGVIGALWRASRRDTERNWKSENSARIEARKQLKDDIAERFDRLEKQTEKAFDALNADAKADAKRLAEFGERLARLEALHKIKNDD